MLHDDEKMGSENESRDLELIKTASWKEPPCEEDCHVCMTIGQEFKKIHIKSLQYLNAPTSIKPVERYL